MLTRVNARRAIILAVLVLAFAAGAEPLLRPDPRPADAPQDDFSAQRAMADVAEIAAEPHPAGSPAMARVAAFLASELASAGIPAERQVVRDPQFGLTLRNVVGRLEGRDPTGAVLLVSHPDSVQWGPGAGDNATGAAALLEAARAAAAGPALRNDLIFLFDDGEELGYRGGYAFARESPLMSEVRLVVGIDIAAWGVPHVLQTSEDNGALIRGYAEAVERPEAFGLRAAFEEDADYETAPFAERGVPAIELEDTYADNDQHTDADSVGGVEAASVQHMGDQILALERAYGESDLADADSPDRSFHTLPLIGVVHYPAGWGLALAILAAAGLAAVAASALRHAGVSRRGLLSGLGLATALTLAVVALSAAAAALYEALYPNPSPHPVDEYLLSSSTPFVIVAGIVIATLFGFAYRRFARRLGAIEMALGFLALWLVLSVTFVVLVPVAAYYLLWPLLIAWTAWLVVLRRPETDLLLLAPAVLAVLLASPVMLLSLVGGGVADLPTLSVSPALIAGLIATALIGVERPQAPAG